MKIKLTEKQIVAKSDSRFKQLDNLCFRAKNLYNRALYLTRHSLFDENFQFAGNFESSLRADEEHPDYRNMLDMASAQQVLRQVTPHFWSRMFERTGMMMLIPENEQAVISPHIPITVAQQKVLDELNYEIVI